MPNYTGYITNARAARTVFQTLHARHDQKSHGRGGGGRKKSGGGMSESQMLAERARKKDAFGLVAAEGGGWKWNTTGASQYLSKPLSGKIAEISERMGFSRTALHGVIRPESRTSPSSPLRFRAEISGISKAKNDFMSLAIGRNYDSISAAKKSFEQLD